MNYRASTVVTTLSVSNGERWGSWGEEQYCAPGTYAVGYNLKIEEKQGSGDDTSLNGIQLVCTGVNETTATSSVGPWGNWAGFCDKRDGKQHFLTSFRLQVEAWRPNNDDTSANYVEFRCRDLNATLPSYDLKMDPGVGFWGSFGSWSSECLQYAVLKQSWRNG